MIKDLEEFWTKVDEIRTARSISWTALVGGNTTLAVNKTLNPSLKKLLNIQEVLGVSLVNIVPYDSFENTGLVYKDPQTRNKMDLIYKLTRNPEWINDSESVRKVQEIGKTII